MTSMNSARVQAEELWASVLEAMPRDLHSRYALVQARQRLIGMENEAEISREIDSLAIDAFGASQVATIDSPRNQEPDQPAKPSLAEIEDQVRTAVYSGFSGTTDGSRERAEIFRQRGLAAAEGVIANNRHLGWLKKRRLRALAREVAEEGMKAAMKSPGDHV